MQLLSSLPLAWVLKANTAVGIEDLGGFRMDAELNPLNECIEFLLEH